MSLAGLEVDVERLSHVECLVRSDGVEDVPVGLHLAAELGREAGCFEAGAVVGDERDRSDLAAACVDEQLAQGAVEESLAFADREFDRLAPFAA